MQPLLVFATNQLHVESKTLNREVQEEDAEVAVRRAIDPLSVIGLVVSVASAIQGAVCNFTDVC